MSVPARTALIDDHPLFRMGLRSALDRDPGLHVAIDTGSPREVLALVADGEPLDVAIVDLVLPEMTGVELALEIRKRQPDCRILGLSMLEDPVRIAELVRAGASGFAHKTQSPAEIIEAIHCVLGGVRYLPPAMAADEIYRLAKAADAWPLERLTPREREVFALMADGCSNDEIASRLFIAKRTVETHRHHVMNKLGARSVVDLVRIAQRFGVAVT